MGFRISIAAAVAATVQSVASDRSALFEPTGPWTVEVSDGLCLVGRTYGKDQRQPTLGFRQVPANDDFEIGLWLDDPSKDGTYGRAKLGLDERKPIVAPFSAGAVAIKGLRLIWIAPKRAQLDGLDTAKVMKLEAGGFQGVFQLRSIPAALRALRDCERKLLVSWGMDEAALASIATPPQGNLIRFFSTSDYPIDALRTRQQGTTAVRFWVNTDGKIRDCQVVTSSGSPLLDARSCQVITKRARLDPARTKEGAPVASIAFARIRWFL